MYFRRRISMTFRELKRSFGRLFTFQCSTTALKVTGGFVAVSRYVGLFMPSVSRMPISLSFAAVLLIEGFSPSLTATCSRFSGVSRQYRPTHFLPTKQTEPACPDRLDIRRPFRCRFGATGFTVADLSTFSGEVAAKRVSFWLVRGAPGRRWLQRLAVINIEQK